MSDVENPGMKFREDYWGVVLFNILFTAKPNGVKQLDFVKKMSSVDKEMSIHTRYKMEMEKLSVLIKHFNTTIDILYEYYDGKLQDYKGKHKLELLNIWNMEEFKSNLTKDWRELVPIVAIQQGPILKKYGPAKARKLLFDWQKFVEAFNMHKFIHRPHEPKVGPKRERDEPATMPSTSPSKRWKKEEK